MRPGAAATRGALTVLLTATCTAATLAQASASPGRVAQLCSSGHQEVIALMLRPDNLARALECASGLDSPDVDRGDVIARLLDDFGRAPRWAHEEVLSAALSGWQATDVPDSVRDRALAALADALPHLSAPTLRGEALRVLAAAGVPSLVAIVSGEAERLESELRRGTRADPALARLVTRVAEVAEVAVAAARRAPPTSAAPLLADVVARLVEVAPDGASVAAARAAAANLFRGGGDR